MLELINRARANGGAEATRLGLSGLQEGPPNINGESSTIANTAQPLSWNPLLFNCAQNHSKLLNDNDQFFLGVSPHTFGGMTPDQRINAAGYPMNLSTEYNGLKTASGFFPGPENVAENISSGSGPFTGAKLITTILSQRLDAPPGGGRSERADRRVYSDGHAAEEGDRSRDRPIVESARAARESDA